MEERNTRKLLLIIRMGVLKFLAKERLANVRFIDQTEGTRSRGNQRVN